MLRMVRSAGRKRSVHDIALPASCRFMRERRKSPGRMPLFFQHVYYRAFTELERNGVYNRRKVLVLALRLASLRLLAGSGGGLAFFLDSGTNVICCSPTTSPVRVFAVRVCF